MEISDAVRKIIAKLLANIFIYWSISKSAELYYD